MLLSALTIPSSAYLTPESLGARIGEPYSVPSLVREANTYLVASQSRAKPAIDKKLLIGGAVAFAVIAYMIVKGGKRGR